MILALSLLFQECKDLILLHLGYLDYSSYIINIKFFGLEEQSHFNIKNIVFYVSMKCRNVLCMGYSILGFAEWFAYIFTKFGRHGKFKLQPCLNLILYCYLTRMNIHFIQSMLTYVGCGIHLICYIFQKLFS